MSSERKGEGGEGYRQESVEGKGKALLEEVQGEEKREWCGAGEVSYGAHPIRTYVPLCMTHTSAGRYQVRYAYHDTYTLVRSTIYLRYCEIDATQCNGKESSGVF